MEERQPLTNYFHSILLTVVGQAFTAAGYTLQEKSVQWAGGQFRFIKPLENGLYGLIEFQVLVYADNAWLAGQSSRFRVTLIRSDNAAGRATDHDSYAKRTLSQLVVTDFGVAILSDADYWWQFRDTDSMGKALAEAGHLVIGYGIPWLAGDLMPDTTQDA